MSGKTLISDLRRYGLPTKSKHYDRLPSKVLKDTPYQVVIDNGQPMLGEDGTLICYTDGSGIDDKYGAACLLMDELGGITSDKMRLSDHATVFQSEVKAITMACDLFMTKERDETKEKE